MPFRHGIAPCEYIFRQSKSPLSFRNFLSSSDFICFSSALLSIIVETGSLKYVLYTMISVLTEQEAKELIEKHIADLEEKRNYWEYWRDLKGNATANKLMKLSFDMTIHSLEDQIAWHEELVHGLDVYRKE